MTTTERKTGWRDQVLVEVQEDLRTGNVQWTGLNMADLLELNALAKRLREFREARGLSRELVAQKMDVPETVLEEFEAYRLPTVRLGFLARYARTVGMRLTLGVEAATEPAEKSA